MQWPSSQCHCRVPGANCLSSSGLSADLVPCLSPHEWAPHREDGREAMSPAQAPLAARLHNVARPPGLIAEAGRHYSTQESVRDYLVASEYNGTEYAGLIVDQGTPSGSHSVTPQAQWRCRDTPQSQGCRAVVCAELTSPVVPATPACREQSPEGPREGPK